MPISKNSLRRAIGANPVQGGVSQEVMRRIAAHMPTPHPEPDSLNREQAREYIVAQLNLQTGDETDQVGWGPNRQPPGLMAFEDVNATPTGQTGATQPLTPPQTEPAAAPVQPAQPVAYQQEGGHGLRNFALTAISAAVIVGAIAFGVLIGRSLDDSSQEDTKVTVSSTNVPGTATATANETAKAAGTLPTPSSGTSACNTNSPNIPCVIAQGVKAHFTPFEIDGEVVGGPADQWWPLQRADGTFVPNSYKLVGMRQSDRGLPGYELHVPANMIMDVWLDGPTFTNRKTAVRIYGPANVNAEFRGAEATLYTRPVDFVGSLSGKWARLTDKYECGDFVTAGTTPPVVGTAHDCHQAGNAPDGKSSAPSGGTTSSAIQQTSGKTGSLDTVKSVLVNYPSRLKILQEERGPALKLESGECLAFDLPAGFTGQVWDGATVTTVTGPVKLARVCEATFRAAS